MVSRKLMALALALGLAGCGAQENRGSKLLDEIDPVGEHDHYLGKIIVNGPGVRKFQDATSGSIDVAFWTTTRFERINTSSSAVPDQGIREVRAFPKKGASVEVFFRAGRNFPPMIPWFTPTNQGFSKTINLRRIDVNNMLITRQNGTTYRSRGSYNVLFKKNPDDSYSSYDSGSIVLQAATETGVDVPEGYIYLVQVSASSEEGSVLTHNEEVDFRR